MNAATAMASGTATAIAGGPTQNGAATAIAGGQNQGNAATAIADGQKSICCHGDG